MLPDEQTSPEQAEIYRRMSPEKKLMLSESLYWAAREIKTAGVRAQHPDWSEDQIRTEVTRIFLHARS